MADQNEIVFTIKLKEAFTQAIKSVNDGLGRLESAGRRASSSLTLIQRSSQTAESGFGKLAGVLTRLAAAYASVAAANKSIEIAKGQVEAEQRLSNALRNNAELLERRKAAIADLARQTTFSKSDVTSAEALLRTFGVSDNQIDVVLKAVVNRAAAFNTSLEEQARQIGITFATGLTGELGEREAGVRNLGAAALKSGAQFQILADKYSGFAQGLAGSDFGRAAQQANVFSEAVGKIGAALLNAKTFLGDLLLPVVQKIADLFEKIQGVGVVGLVEGVVAQLKIIFEYVKGGFKTITGFVGDVFDYARLRAEQFFHHAAAVALDAFAKVGDKLGFLGIDSSRARQAAGFSRDLAGQAGAAAAGIDFTGNATNRFNAAVAAADAIAAADSERAGKEASAAAKLEAIRRVNQALIEREKIQKDISDLEAKGVTTADKTTQQLEQQQKLLAKSREELVEIQRKLPGLFDEEKRSGINPALTSEVNRLLARQAQLVGVIKQGEQSIAELRAQQVRDVLDRGEKALSLYNASVQANANLVQAGSLTGGQAQRLNAEALDRLKEKVLATAAAVRGAIADGVLSQQDAEELGQRLANLQGSIPHIATDVEKLSSDLRDGLQSPFESFFQTILSGTAGVKKAFQSLAADILQSIERLLANRLAEQFLNFLGGGTAGSNTANGGPQSKGLLGGLGGLLSGLLGPIGGIFKLFGFAEGGVVPGVGSGDSVPAMLTPGEFVLPRRAVSAIGLGQLEAIRRAFAGLSIVPPPRGVSFSVPQPFAAGGLVGGSSAPSAGSVNVLPTLVADDQRMERLLKGGRSSVISFLGRNSQEVRAALGI